MNLDVGADEDEVLPSSPAVPGSSRYFISDYSILEASASMQGIPETTVKKIGRVSESIDTESRDATSHDLEERATETGNTPRYPMRKNRKPPQRFMVASGKSKINSNVSTGDETTLGEAMKATSEERDLWPSAIQEEIDSLNEKNTWIVDEYPKSKKLSTHIVLKIKRDTNGHPEIFKARVVARGNFQTYDQDYKEAYPPLAPFSLIRMFLYLDLSMSMSIAQVDVKRAFLNGHLKEDVWVMSPHGIPWIKSKCFRLLKAMYSLKQAHLAWNTKLCTDLCKIGFKDMENAACVFMRLERNGNRSFSIIYMEDLLVFAHCKIILKSIVKEFQSLYELRVSKRLELFLGVEINWERMVLIEYLEHCT